MYFVNDLDHADDLSILARDVIELNAETLEYIKRMRQESLMHPAAARHAPSMHTPSPAGR